MLELSSTMTYAKFSLLLFFFVLSLSSGEMIIGALDEMDFHPPSITAAKSYLGHEVRLNFIHKDVVPNKSRKLLEDLVQLDYDYAGPNPKHDPKKGRGGGRNP